uniref:F-box domain-containing protein n=1 Tax=Romanomermis culicivorax TaxID=13658 RepID=A0A915L972_ROMCU
MKAILGENWQQYFLNFEHDVCGSGCVAQVHKARLDVKRAIKNSDFQLEKQAKFSSMDVAIKILHPSVGRDLEVDLAVLHFFASLASLFQISNAIDIKESLEQFSEALWKQRSANKTSAAQMHFSVCLRDSRFIDPGMNPPCYIKYIDLRFESTALKIFRHNFRWNDDVRFPQPLLESPCVLIETFEEGSPITDFLDHPDTKLKCKLAKWGMNALLKMIFDDNFVHCDMHSGNIFVQERSTDDYDQDLLDQTFANYLKTDADRPTLLERFRSTIMAVYGRLSYRLSRMGFIENQYRLILLDTGLFAELSQRDLNNLKAVFRAIVVNDNFLWVTVHCKNAFKNKNNINCNSISKWKTMNISKSNKKVNSKWFAIESEIIIGISEFHICGAWSKRLLLFIYSANFCRAMAGSPTFSRSAFEPMLEKAKGKRCSSFVLSPSVERPRNQNFSALDTERVTFARLLISQPKLKKFNFENCINKLSDEMILSIFQFLPKKTLVACSKTCHRWCRLSKDDTLWNRIDLWNNKRIQASHLHRLLNRGVEVMRLARTEI